MSTILPNVQTIATLIGHKGRCFDLRCYLCPNELGESPSTLLLSSSEDGTSKLWEPSQKKCLQTMMHNKNAEVLRSTVVGNLYQSSAVVCTAGSDGKASLWKIDYPLTTMTDALTKVATMIHRNDESQVYACESHPQFPEYLLTGADNELRVWNISHDTTTPCNQWNFFLPNPSENSDRVHFGGDHRNPDRESYVFDAKWHPSSPSMLSAILSDNSLKILDLRMKDIQCSLNFPSQVYNDEMQQFSKLGHPTSMYWINPESRPNCTLPENGNLCSISFGSGHIGLLDLRKMELLSLVKIHSRASYGSFTLPGYKADEIELVSWASDQSICHWSYSQSSPSSSIDPSTLVIDQLREEGNNTSSDNNGGEISIHGMFELPSFSPLVCCPSPIQSNLFYCGGEMRSSQQSNSHNKGLSFLGTPLYVCQLPSLTNRSSNVPK